MKFEQPEIEQKGKIPTEEILKGVGVDTVEELKAALDAEIKNSPTTKQYVEFLKEVFKDVKQKL